MDEGLQRQYLNKIRKQLRNGFRFLTEIPLARLQHIKPSLILKRHKTPKISPKDRLDHLQMTPGQDHRVNAKVLKDHLEIVGQELNPSITVAVDARIQKERILWAEFGQD